jgi:hypothetical protein
MNENGQARNIISANQSQEMQVESAPSTATQTFETPHNNSNNAGSWHFHHNQVYVRKT